MPSELRTEGVFYVVRRNLDGSRTHWLTNLPELKTYGSIKADLLRLAAHLDRDASDEAKQHSVALASATKGWSDQTGLYINEDTKPLRQWLEAAIPIIDEDNEREIKRRDAIAEIFQRRQAYLNALSELENRVPVIVLFSNIFRVRPSIHLAHLAARLSSGVMDDDQYDYGNSCLLKLLGFTAQQLSELGGVAEPDRDNSAELDRYKDQLDSRNYQLNAASIKLSKEIRDVWNPDEKKSEASKLRLVADGQYLKVVVEDSEGVEVELDQRSEGFQWLVSFFVVFFSETSDKHANAILLLDEPGVSLHALKQRDFRTTIGKLASQNQTIYTTHSPFMVGPDELDIVRVVEMTDREVGTKVHTSITSSDPAAILPLQEALGYDLAQSLFAQQRNLICEGLTDNWYIEATSSLFRAGGEVGLNDKIALVPSGTAGKIVYFATILTAHKLKVAALLDSDSAGDNAAKQDVLVHKLGAKRILRTTDYTTQKVPKAEIEDLTRDTLTQLAKTELSIDVTSEAVAEPGTPICDLLNRKSGNAFSKYQLAKAYVRWTRDHSLQDMSTGDREAWSKLFAAINAALK